MANINRLPFVVQPRRQPITVRIGTEESGIMEVMRKGYLTTGEKAFMQSAIGSDETTVKIVSISRKIANDLNVPLDTAYADVVAILGGKSAVDDRLKDIEVRYMDDFSDLLTLLTGMQTKEKLIAALCMLKYRVNSDLDINDVLTLHPDLIVGLSDLYDMEERKSIEGLEVEESSDYSASKDEPLTVEQIEKKPRGRRSQN